ncbi:MAG: response regulator transcription factor [Armatimonadetes bacterium]|nr:response regulator transcription factor [Armatimonadota bacterium]
MPEHITIEEDPGQELEPPCAATILLVDDEEPIVMMVALFLRRAGHNVLATTSPRDALALASRHRGAINLLISDVMMPDINGFVLAEALRETAPCAACVLMSGYAADIVHSLDTADRNVALLEKPFTRRELLDAVNAALGR